jgi:hypothetical protein
LIRLKSKKAFAVDLPDTFRAAVAAVELPAAFHEIVKAFDLDTAAAEAACAEMAEAGDIELETRWAGGEWSSVVKNPGSGAARIRRALWSGRWVTRTALRSPARPMSASEFDAVINAMIRRGEVETRMVGRDGGNNGRPRREYRLAGRAER